MKKALLLLIVFIALLLRTYHVAENPPSLSWDEVSIGYNAYSILKTGRDEHGRYFPLNTFIAYGDYKPPFSIYATVPFVGLFGLNELAVRLPSVIFGTLTIVMTYLLVMQLIPNIALLSAAILAISPWHINISRGGFEANIALFFSVLGIWLILKAQTNVRYWPYAWIPFVVTIYTFNSSRIFVVLLFPALLLFSATSIKKHVWSFGIGILIAFLALLPILPHLLSKEARLRFSEVSIFTDSSIITTSNTRIDRGGNNLISRVVNNRRVGYARSYLLHFFDNLQPEFLFIKGDGNPKFSIRDVGQLYMIEAPFLVIGILALLKTYPRVGMLLLWWLIAAIIPAGVARETPHALRILNSLPTWQIFIAYGIYVSTTYMKRKLFIFFIMLMYVLSMTYYLHNYYVHYPVEFSGEWQYGYKQALIAIQPIESSYEKIVISDIIGRPYMYTLFYIQTHPNDFKITANSYFDAAGFYHVDGFAKYIFAQALPETLEKNTLYIWPFAPKGARVIDTIKLLNGSPVLVVFDI